MAVVISYWLFILNVLYLHGPVICMLFKRFDYWTVDTAVTVTDDSFQKCAHLEASKSNTIEEVKKIQ